MKDDLKIIKKQYGENMSKLCRELFPTLLESNGLLSGLMLSKFSDNHFLYDDLKEYDLIYDFKNYIYGLIDAGNNNKIISAKSPKELLDEAGYTLYECYDEEDIQSFKKYYEQGEELCTFDDDRLKRCYVFFAVKKNASFIKRDNFKNPKRQDAYGTSVISIQFTRDNSHTLSIKNRYNHTVNNPDSTFSNNLDNIIPGLTSAFENEYGLIQKNENSDLEIPNYVRAKDDKFYKYNHEINNIYYCINNIIIDNFEVKNFNHEKYIIMDYFIVDLINKKVRLYDESIRDSFIEHFDNIDKIEILKDTDNKIIDFIKNNQEHIIIKLDKQNIMREYVNNNIKEIGDFFLFKDNYLKKINLLNVEKIGNHFMDEQFWLESIFLPNVRIIGDFFMERSSIQKIIANKLETVGNNFLTLNNSITVLTLPNLQKIGNNFFEYNRFLEHFNAENLESFGNNFFSQNWRINSVTFPKLQEVGDNYFNCNLSMKYRIDEIINENTNGKEK